MYIMYNVLGDLSYVAKDKEELKEELKAYFYMICESEYVHDKIVYDTNSMFTLVDEMRIVEEDKIEQAKKEKIKKKSKFYYDINVHPVCVSSLTPKEIFGRDFYTEMLDYVTDRLYKTKE